MQAILKNKHQRFWNWLHDIKSRQSPGDSKLIELENEMLQYYDMYLEKRDELRNIIQEYEERQKRIRNRVKSYRKIDLRIENVGIVNSASQEMSPGILPK